MHEQNPEASARKTLGQIEHVATDATTRRLCREHDVQRCRAASSRDSATHAGAC
jgi:hypothetical protein